MSDSEAVARDEFFESLLGDFLDESGSCLIDSTRTCCNSMIGFVRSMKTTPNVATKT